MLILEMLLILGDMPIEMHNLVVIVWIIAFAVGCIFWSWSKDDIDWERKRREMYPERYARKQLKKERKQLNREKKIERQRIIYKYGSVYVRIKSQEG